MRRHCKFYTSVKSGITMSFKGWLQIISQKEYGRELCMTAPSLWEPVIARFNEYKQNGIFIPAKRRRRYVQQVVHQVDNWEQNPRLSVGRVQNQESSN